MTTPDAIYVDDLIYVDGDTEWAVIWRESTGEVLTYGDRYNVHEWLIKSLGLAVLDAADSDWYDPSSRSPRSLEETLRRRTERLATQTAADTMRERAARLRLEAERLEEEADSLGS